MRSRVLIFFWPLVHLHLRDDLGLLTLLVRLLNSLDLHYFFSVDVLISLSKDFCEGTRWGLGQELSERPNPQSILEGHHCNSLIKLVNAQSFLIKFGHKIP